jgi:cytoskeletal protein RodZ
MIAVKNNKITTDLDQLGEQLRRTREEKRLKLEEVAAQVNINLKYLAALENGQFDCLPAGVYGKNFLRQYAQFLGLDISEDLAAIKSEADGQAKKKQPFLFTARAARPTRGIAIPRVAKNALIVLSVSACLLYLAVCFNRVTSPPQLVLDNPANDLVTNESSIEIAGTAEPEARVTVNDEFVLTDSVGKFVKTISLKNGLNTILVTSQKQYSRKSTISRNVMVEKTDLLKY